MNLKDLNIEISFLDSTISFNNVDIVVHNKISLNNKMSFISDVINFSIDANRFSNDVTVRAYFTLCILKYYTNLELTEEEFLNPADTYDLIVESGLYDIIASKIDKNELSIVSERKESHDSVLKFISAPTRLEFLTSVALVQHFKGLDVNPNYAVDDEGLPTFTAGGGLADIECYDSDYDSYFEVSLMCGKSNWHS